MFNSQILDIAITLIFVYFLLAMIITGVNEMGFSFLHKKAIKLKKAMENLFFDEEWAEIAPKVLQSPFITSLKKSPKTFPSTIPAKNFALALLSVIGKGKTDIETLSKIINQKENKGELYSILSILIAYPGIKTEELLAEIESIFNNSMDRVKGWFSSYAKKCSFSVAIAIAIVGNIDTIRITEQLWQNKNIATQNAEMISIMAPIVAEQHKELMNAQPIENDSTTKKARKPLLGEMKEIKKELQKLPIPVGWYNDNTLCPKGSYLEIIVAWGLKIAGIILTAFAVTLGAPFWYDLLQKASPLRKKA